jgi:hypothetical protein
MPTLTICVTVDWEGWNLEPANLNAMTAFRKQFPTIPLTHFICPAYLTRDGNLQEISGLISEQVRRGDEVALHVHCWQSLLTAAGVNPVLEPSWYINGDVGPTFNYGNGQVDQGHGVPLGFYSAENVGKIIAYGNQLLVKNHIALATPVSFRCGGWMSADPVQVALQAQHVANDSSSTDAPYFTQIDHLLRNANCQLATWVAKLWGTIAVPHPTYLANTLSHEVQPAGGTATTQPYPISGVLQVPDNGVLADYLKVQMMYDRLHEAWQLAAQRDFVHVCGFHQESATFQNIYGEKSTNLDNFTTALAQFLSDVGPVAADAVDDNELAAGRIVPIASSGVPKASGNQKVVFNTDRGISKRLPGVEVEYVPLGATERQQRRDRLAKALASPPDMTKRFWG